LNYYYVPGYTYTIDQPARILEEFKDEPFKDVIAWRPLLPLTENDSYRTTSYFLPLAYEDLEASGKNYPAAIKRMYLQLPDDFSNRITQLSDAITAGLKSNFSKTLAITDYLRRQYTYSTEVADIPQHLDPVFWFIFEEKSGFCNYYASAEVLMLRSIDIPARLAVGYAQGVEIEHGKVFGVRDRDSHAWVEVYFPEIGWVVFEPTSSQPAVQFPMLPLKPVMMPVNWQAILAKRRRIPPHQQATEMLFPVSRRLKEGWRLRKMPCTLPRGNSLDQNHFCDCYGMFPWQACSDFFYLESKEKRDVDSITGIYGRMDRTEGESKSAMVEPLGRLSKFEQYP
jgi:hypothetical protein